jgi:hypothetical protein
MLFFESSEGVSFEGAELGADETVSVASCQRSTGLTAEQCGEFMALANLPAVDPVSSMIIRGAVRAAILTYGTKACAAAAQGQGVPGPLAKPACAWMIGKIMPAVSRVLELVGEPVTLKAEALWGPPFSRPCASAAELRPGEHFVPASPARPSRCSLNVAVLRPRDKPVAAMVYIPCERMPKGALQDVFPRAIAFCRNRDGRTTPTGLKTPTNSPGFYTERFKPDAGYWPSMLETWPYTDDLSMQAMSVAAMAPLERFASVGAQTFPAGSIAAFDPAIKAYRIAAPVGLSGAAYREVATAKIQPSGVTMVSLPTYQEQTGTRPWFKNWKIWAGVGAGIAVLAGTGYAVSRLRR